MYVLLVYFYFSKQKTAYEILTCDWSSDVCSSDLSKIVVLFKIISEKEFFLYSGLFTLLIGVILVAISDRKSVV